MATRPFIMAASIGMCAVVAGFLLSLGSHTRAEAMSFIDLKPGQPGVVTIRETLSAAQFNLTVDLPANHLLLLDIDAEIIGSALDSVLQVLDSDGGVIAENDDDSTLTTFDSALGMIIRNTGRYTIRIMDLQGRFGPGFFFLLNGTLMPLP